MTGEGENIDDVDRGRAFALVAGDFDDKKNSRKDIFERLSRSHDLYAAIFGVDEKAFSSVTIVAREVLR